MEESAHHHLRQNAQTWRADPKAASEIEARLAAHGYDAQAVNVQVYLEAHEIFLAIEALLNSAQNRRLSLLREIDNRRYTRNKPKSHLKQVDALTDCKQGPPLVEADLGYGSHSGRTW